MVAGYRTYIELIEPFLTHQEVVATGMKAEVKRCQAAIDRAMAERGWPWSQRRRGHLWYGRVGAGICAARGLREAPAGEGGGEVDFYLEVVPGVPALAAAAALLGVPVMHDFAVISLSDLLTPWEIIQKRVELAAAGDLAQHRALQS